jgi:hypothetical protein
MALVKKLKYILLSEGPWPIVVLVAIGAIMFTLIAIFAPPGVRDVLFGANGFIMTLLGALIRSPLHGLPESDDDEPKDP